MVNENMRTHIITPGPPPLPLEKKEEQLQAIVDMVNLSDISSIKITINAILKVISNDNTTVRELKEIIELDPPLAAKVLKTANSAYYSRSYTRTLMDIEQAIIWMGFEIIKELALGQKVCEIFNRDEAINGYSRKILWKHSIAVALMAKSISRKEYALKGENAYAAGLLHDIGVIAEDQFLRDPFRAVLHLSRNRKIDLPQAETELLGFNHAELGEAIAQSWNLPQDLIDSIGGHHLPLNRPPGNQRLTATLFVCDYICQENNLGYSPIPLHNPLLLDQCLYTMDVKPYAIHLIFKDVLQQMAEMEDKGLL